MLCPKLEVLAFNTIARAYLLEDRREQRDFLARFPRGYRVRANSLLVLFDEEERLTEDSQPFIGQERTFLQDVPVLLLYILLACLVFLTSLLFMYALIRFTEASAPNRRASWG